MNEYNIYTNMFTLLQTENEFDNSNTKKEEDDQDEERRDGQEDQEGYMYNICALLNI